MRKDKKPDNEGLEYEIGYLDKDDNPVRGPDFDAELQAAGDAVFGSPEDGELESVPYSPIEGVEFDEGGDIIDDWNSHEMTPDDDEDDLEDDDLEGGEEGEGGEDDEEDEEDEGWEE